MIRRERIGLFGGTFDPIHNGHLHAAGLVQTRFGLDRVFFIPAAVPPHKARPDMASARDRLRMTALAVNGHAFWTASPVELRAGGLSYSIRTIETMRRRFPKARLFFIVGADAFLEIKTWREWERVLRSCAFIVMTRPGSRLVAASAVLGPAWKHSLRRIAPGERLKDGAFEPPCVFFLPIAALPVSSTQIRGRARSGRSLAGLVPRAVADHIRTKRLYRERPALRRGLSMSHPARRSEKIR
jgi:nicotinate-nucleotide adenylyltransferase